MANNIKVNSPPQEWPDIIICSANKARNLLNYKTQVTLKEGIQKTFEYIKKRGVKPFEYHINIEINNDLTPETWTKKEI